MSRVTSNGTPFSATHSSRIFRRYRPRQVRRSRLADVGTSSGYGEGKEGESIAMSVHPDEVPLMNAMLKAEGVVGAYYDATKRNNCRITSRAGRRGVMKVLSRMHSSTIHDGDAGYGDG